MDLSDLNQGLRQYLNSVKISSDEQLQGILLQPNTLPLRLHQRQKSLREFGVLGRERAFATSAVYQHMLLPHITASEHILEAQLIEGSSLSSMQSIIGADVAWVDAVPMDEVVDTDVARYFVTPNHEYGTDELLRIYRGIAHSEVTLRPGFDTQHELLYSLFNVTRHPVADVAPLSKEDVEHGMTMFFAWLATRDASFDTIDNWSLPDDVSSLSYYESLDLREQTFLRQGIEWVRYRRSALEEESGSAPVAASLTQHARLEIAVQASRVDFARVLLSLRQLRKSRIDSTLAALEHREDLLRALSLYFKKCFWPFPLDCCKQQTHVLHFPAESSKRYRVYTRVDDQGNNVLRHAAPAQNNNTDGVVPAGVSYGSLGIAYGFDVLLIESVHANVWRLYTHKQVYPGCWLLIPNDSNLQEKDKWYRVRVNRLLRERMVDRNIPMDARREDANYGTTERYRESTVELQWTPCDEEPYRLDHLLAEKPSRVQCDTAITLVHEDPRLQQAYLGSLYKVVDTTIYVLVYLDTEVPMTHGIVLRQYDAKTDTHTRSDVIVPWTSFPLQGVVRNLFWIEYTRSIDISMVAYEQVQIPRRRLRERSVVLPAQLVSQAVCQDTRGGHLQTGFTILIVFSLFIGAIWLISFPTKRGRHRNVNVRR